MLVPPPSCCPDIDEPPNADMEELPPIGMAIEALIVAADLWTWAFWPACIILGEANSAFDPMGVVAILELVPI